ncbi:hypothetical protein K32_24270 [Kaistia sp. 32K]|uniref:hypothetical protein n=1 Tax=Kaistia sp. 32K TaxID=2795690 RepID=UPI0019169572|nr:hypothetical protein [Kaistia sp. 32K]BCP53810.1 hypothetical protein K32_24270 [Kaistia sp. 32K]
MTKPQIPDEKADMPADGGDKPLDSHVQAQAPVYGEPKGPRPATMFRHKFGVPPPLDRERDGFIGGRDEVGLGDVVGSGPEEWERKPKSQAENGDEGRPDKASD